jgi:tripartite-type tricarboxylate transporter receptor subunit TctC
MRAVSVHRNARRALLIAGALLVSALSDAHAQSDEQFYKGKVINFYIGFAPGGTYDYYSRLFARFIGKHIPGNPTVIPQNMPGAGSLQAANFIFSVAPKDGTALGMITQTVAIEEALHSPGVQYRAAELNWIGRMSAILEVHFTWKTSKVKSMADAMEHDIPLAGTGAGSPSQAYPRLLNALAGTRFKIVSGYPGSTQGMMAMERGEVDGALTSWNTLRRTKQAWLDNRQINLLVQYAYERHSAIADVPTMIEIGKTPEARQVFAFFISSAAVGRSVVGPAGLPPGRLKILRDAFDAMLKDAEFLAEIDRTGLEFSPGSGAQLEKLIRETANTPSDVVERTTSILRQ